MREGATMNQVVRMPVDLDRWPQKVRAELSAMSFEGLRLRVAKEPRDFEIVSKLRADGFGRLFKESDPNEYAWIGETDFAKTCKVLIAEDVDGLPIATIRVQDGRQTLVELARFTPLEQLVDEADLPVAQFARLSAPKSPRSREAMFALFKSAWRWTRKEGIQSIVLATPRWSKPIYETLLFRDLGERAAFRHGYGTPTQHRTMLLNAQGAEELWRSHNHPLSKLFFDTCHPALELA